LPILCDKNGAFLKNQCYNPNKKINSMYFEEKNGNFTQKILAEIFSKS
jgi:hypothetical protein